MTETFLGGVAALHLCRYPYSTKSFIVLSQWRNPWGYGLYFTDSRLIGVSYTKYLSRAYVPAWILSAAWIIILVSDIAWLRVTNTESPPLWTLLLLLGPLFGAMIASMIFLVYLSEKRASRQIDGLVVSSVWELETLPKDAALQRSDISQISVQTRKFRDPSRGWVRGSLITVTLKAGQSFAFISDLDRDNFGRLLLLFQDFCSQDPPINFSLN